MKYSKYKFKYLVEENFFIQTPIKPEKTIDTWYATLLTTGLLKVKKGFASDGASGPTFDTESTKQPCVEHDILYKMMRKKLLGLSWRPIIDKFLGVRLIQEGMWPCRARKWVKALEIAGENAASKPVKIYTTKKHVF